MSIAITALYAGLLGVVLFVLSYRVVQQRRASSISLGHKEDKVLERRIRGHGNFVEYVPMCLILLAALEMQGGPVWLVHGLGLMLLAGRLLHGYAFGFTDFSPLRMPGAALTFTALALLSIANVVMAF